MKLKMTLCVCVLSLQDWSSDLLTVSMAMGKPSSPGLKKKDVDLRVTMTPWQQWVSTLAPYFWCVHRKRNECDVPPVSLAKHLVLQYKVLPSPRRSCFRPHWWVCLLNSKFATKVAGGFLNGIFCWSWGRGLQLMHWMSVVKKDVI